MVKQQPACLIHETSIRPADADDRGHAAGHAAGLRRLAGEDRAGARGNAIMDGESRVFGPQTGALEWRTGPRIAFLAAKSDGRRCRPVVFSPASTIGSTGGRRNKSSLSCYQDNRYLFALIFDSTIIGGELRATAPPRSFTINGRPDQWSRVLGPQNPGPPNRTCPTCRGPGTMPGLSEAPTAIAPATPRLPRINPASVRRDGRPKARRELVHLYMRR